VSFVLSSEYFPASNPPADRSRPATFPGVAFLHHDNCAESPLSGRLSTTYLCSALSVSHTLSGLLLPVPGGLISSRSPCPRFALQGLSSPLSRVDSSPPLFSLDLLQTGPFASELPRLHQRLKLGLQSLNPSVDPLTQTECLRLLAPRSPLELSNPAGFYRPPWQRLRTPSAHGLSC